MLLLLIGVGGIAMGVIGEGNVTEIVEPSCGDGSFYHHDKYVPDLGIDIKLGFEREGVVEHDFLTYPMSYKEGRLFIGNPPFGVRNNLVKAFYKRCCSLGDYIGFILPITYLDNDIQLYQFDLVESVDLGVCMYSGKPIHCCFNVYARPKGGLLNEKIDYTLNEIEILEYVRGVESYNECSIKKGYFHSLCNWGQSIGVVPRSVGEYSQELYIYCDDVGLRRKVVDLTKASSLKAYFGFVATPKVTKMQLYKYLYENIEGLTLKNGCRKEATLFD